MFDDIFELVLCVAGAELPRVGVHCEGHLDGGCDGDDDG